MQLLISSEFVSWSKEISSCCHAGSELDLAWLVPADWYVSLSFFLTLSPTKYMYTVHGESCCIVALARTFCGLHVTNQYRYIAKPLSIGNAPTTHTSF